MKVVLFGIGYYYNLYKNCFLETNIVALADNDEKKHNMIVDGFSIMSPKQAIQLDFDRIFLLASPDYTSNMKRQLIDLGVDEKKIAYIFDIRRYCENVKDYSMLQIFTKSFGKRRHKKGIAIFHPTRGCSINGVDTCLFLLCRVLNKYYDIHVILARDCVLRERLLEQDVTVIIDQYSNVKCLDDFYWRDMYDVVVINSIDRYNILDGLKGTTRIPVIWWLHSVGNTISEIPLHRLNHIEKKYMHVYAVSPLSRELFNQQLPNWGIRPLLYGLEDQAVDEVPLRKTSDKIIFAIVGRWGVGKAQDVLIDAILLLPMEIRSQCEFWFVGYMDKDRAFEKKHLKKIESVQNVKLLGVLHGKELIAMYRAISVLVCPSRADAMPIVCVEAMMHYHPCIVSENVGTKFLIQDKENGLICKTEDPFDLKNKIEWCVNNRDTVTEMGQKARSIYENYFTMSKFEENIISIFKELGI